MGVGGREIKTIGYTCRSVALKVFGPGFNSRRLHQPTPRPSDRGVLVTGWMTASTQRWMRFGLLNLNQTLPHVGVNVSCLLGQVAFSGRCQPMSRWGGSITLAVALDAGFVFMILGTISH